MPDILDNANGTNFWRTLALMAVSAMSAMILGSFVPSHNIVTADQLESATRPLRIAINQRSDEEKLLGIQIVDLRLSLVELQGELKETIAVNRKP